jgi:hypothetical protein
MFKFLILYTSVHLLFHLVVCSNDSLNIQFDYYQHLYHFKNVLKRSRYDDWSYKSNCQLNNQTKSDCLNLMYEAVQLDFTPTSNLQILQHDNHLYYFWILKNDDINPIIARYNATSTASTSSTTLNYINQKNVEKFHLQIPKYSMLQSFFPYVDYHTGKINILVVVLNFTKYNLYDIHPSIGKHFLLYKNFTLVNVIKTSIGFNILVDTGSNDDDGCKTKDCNYIFIDTIRSFGANDLNNHSYICLNKNAIGNLTILSFQKLHYFIFKNKLGNVNIFTFPASNLNLNFKKSVTSSDNATDVATDKQIYIFDFNGFIFRFRQLASKYLFFETFIGEKFHPFGFIQFNKTINQMSGFRIYNCEYIFIFSTPSELHIISPKSETGTFSILKTIPIKGNVKHLQPFEYNGDYYILINYLDWNSEIYKLYFSNWWKNSFLFNCN